MFYPEQHIYDLEDYPFKIFLKQNFYFEKITDEDIYFYLILGNKPAHSRGQSKSFTKN